MWLRLAGTGLRRDAARHARQAAQENGDVATLARVCTRATPALLAARHVWARRRAALFRFRGRREDVVLAPRRTQEVRLSLVNGGRTHPLRLDEGLRVMRSSALLGDLKALLGPGCLS